MNRKVCVIGLGYVGLPVAVAFARVSKGTIGYDINEKRIQRLTDGQDDTGEISTQELKQSSLIFTSNADNLKDANFFIVTVPTPVDEHRRPDLSPVKSASEIVGRNLKKGDIVVYESTVYPGVTEEFCAPILEKESGLTAGVDFKLAYSPERINPGDSKHSLDKVVKVVSAQDSESLSVVSSMYELIVGAGVHRAPSIRVAEAAKVIENTQRDLNIALMNELAIVFDKMGIRTRDVLDAAGTKWNFLSFAPGLVGGHCIGVDPYYLTTKAEQLGYHPEVILAGRRINDNMGRYIGQRAIKLMVNQGLHIRGARVGVLGLTFKENVPDLRNSRVPDIILELEEFGVETLIHDPLASEEMTAKEYNLKLSDLSQFKELDCLILAVGHNVYKQMKANELVSCIKHGGVFVDIKSIVNPKELRSDVVYWSL